MAFKFARTAGQAAGWFVFMTTACVHAQLPSVRFDVSGYAVEGAPLLKSGDFSRIVAPFIGRQKTIADVQKAREVLQQAYLDLGYCSVRVTLPKAEPDANTVTLKLVQTATPVSNDCLPMVVLDEGARPVPVATGKVATRSLSDVAGLTAEPTAEVEVPARAARAPLKPLQDRPSSVRSTLPAQPETAASPAPADVTIRSLAQAPAQAGLVATSDNPTRTEKPVAASPAPSGPIANAAMLQTTKPMSKAVVASVPQQAPSVEPLPVIDTRDEQVASNSKLVAPSPAAPSSIAPRLVEKPAPDLAMAASAEHELFAPATALRVAFMESVKPPVPEPAIAAVAQPDSPPAPPTQPAIESHKEPVPAKPQSLPISAGSPPATERLVTKAAVPEVEVQPFAGAIAAAEEPSEPAQSVTRRAQVRPLQDRQPLSAVQTPRIADASNSKPAVKASPVVVQSPTVASQAEPAAPADTTATPAALKFDIDRYLVEGNTLLSADVIGKVLVPYTGKQKDFGDVQRALEALQVAYQKLGWGVVQVTLPEQELERGEVRFEVTETRIGKVDVQGNEYFSEANIRRSVPSLKTGETPNSLAMARSLRVANESSVKQSQVSLKAGSNDGEVDATIKVVDDNPRKYSVSLDNTGTSQTGILRLGVGFQHSNLWDRDHQFTFQYITNPEHPSRVTVLGAGYHIPLYGRGDSMDFILGYSDVDSGVVQQLFNVSGAGLIGLGRYNMNLNRIENYEHKITFGLDYKAFQNRVLTTSGVPLVPDITLHPASIAYSGELRTDQTAFNFYTSFSYNAFEGGNDAAQSDFKASRGSAGGASAEYAIWRAGVNYQRLLPADWTFRFAANAQTTRNALVAGEQFGVGGANSVRGFNERVYSNDKGHQATFELITPDIAGKIGFEGGRLRFLTFYDTANLSRNFIQPGEQTGLGIDSVGLGMRLTYREKFSVRLDYAQVLHDGGQDAGLPDGRRNSNTVHASMLFVY